MTQGAEAFQPKFDHDEEHDEEIEPREADIQPIKPTNPMWAKHAKFMASEAGIENLSTETVTMYGILRDEKPGTAKGGPSGMSDQELLAEALRRSGDEASLAKFLDVKNYPHIVKPKP